MSRIEEFEEFRGAGSAPRARTGTPADDRSGSVDRATAALRS